MPIIVRAEKASPHHEKILELYSTCKGNLVRVHEELISAGAQMSYQALTGYCRRHGLGQRVRTPAGSYTFGPGEEMQHDTSPHKARIAGQMVPVQTASLVFCYSRMLFAQLYPTFTRFTCKIFLSDALAYFGGVCRVCMIDNTGVVVLKGTGSEMVPVPEMEAFGARYDFVFRAHEKGDADRSARVEGSFNYIENNFLAGRSFDDFEHANREARAWCDRVNALQSPKLHASRRELFAAEQSQLKPLPLWVPDVYQLHQRIVDDEGYVRLHPCRYSAPYQLIGRQLEVRETKNEIQLYLGPRIVATHPRLLGKTGRVTNPEHRPPRGSKKTTQPSAEEQKLKEVLPEFVEFIEQLKVKTHGRTPLALKRLLRITRDYPPEAVQQAIQTAANFGLYDLERLERMVLRNVDRRFFPGLDGHDPDPEKDR